MNLKINLSPKTPSRRLSNRFGLSGARGGGGHLGIFWVSMCRPGLQIGTPFYKKFPLNLIPRSRIRPKTDTRSRNGPIFYTPF